ncbi:hypothetical protein POTOM_022872 [Populus tomentosa]|uniref:Uncharacterized protein n=1 Tax=Populus tomentosa TaxID=118781 RepID=A0A8X8CYJ8_POPTO|nr:hypothetical protein POTOM_022872 [Populus tomentosa]
MRLHSGLPQTFWADAVHTAVYLINRGPSVPLEFRLPEEVWRGKEVQLSHLKVFGCVSYVHIDSDARNKLEAKSKKCFFIGYGDEEFGFRFWDDQNRKIIRSRNVIFNEKVMYKDRSSEETEMADSDTSPQRSEFIRLEGLPDVTKQNNNQESLQEDSSTSVPTSTQEDAEQLEPAVRRSSRTIKPPQRFTLLLNYILLTDGGEPLSYEESLQDGNSSKTDALNTILHNQHRQEMRRYLYNHQIDWEQTTNLCAKEDLFYPHPLLQDIVWACIHNAVEPLLTRWPFSKLRQRALDSVMQRFHYEDETTQYVCLGPANKVLNMLCCWVEDPNSEAYKCHLARIKDYLWVAEDGMKMQGYNGSQFWDVSFTVQAILATNFADEFAPMLKKAHNFIKNIQLPSDMVGEAMPADRFYDAVNVILSLQNKNGGFASYELTRSYAWLEMLNPAETFGNIMIDNQYGSWGVCFTYGTWFGIKGLVAGGRTYQNSNSIQIACEFLLSKQLVSGGWGESYLSSQDMLDAVNGHVFSAKIDESILWHKRFGHYNLNSLKLLYDTGMVENMSAIHVTAHTCGSCELGK